MSPRLVNIGTSAHQRVQDLLPWYVMESLDAQDRALAEAHLATCLICQRDVEWHRQLRAAHDDAVPPFDVERALASVKARVGEAGSLAQRSRHSRVPRAALIGWAIAAQVVIVAGFYAVTKMPAPTPSTFHALGHSATADASARLLVVFAPDVTEKEMRRILHDSGARIVDGPTSTDAYVLHVPPQHSEAALRALRGERAVARVESLDSEAPR